MQAKQVKLFVLFVLSFYSAISSALEVGATLPNCHLKKMADGSDLNLQATGKVLYVDFWASWCGPCAQSLPFLEAINEEFKNKNFEVIAVNLDEVREDADAFLKQHPVKLTTAVNADGQCPGVFGVQAMPSSYIIDRKGKVRHIQLGFNLSEKAELKQKIEKILAE